MKTVKRRTAPRRRTPRSTRTTAHRPLPSQTRRQASPSTRKAGASSANRTDVDPRLTEGVALYNHRRFFECHETLERLWLETHDASKDFYKGLIQAAVAFYHWSRGNEAGAQTLARSSVRYLKRYAPACCGLDVQEFLTRFSELFQWLRRHRQRYDPHLVPMIRPVKG